jgi:endoglycosylceramidase
VASYFKNEENVLGYELINEPFVGNFYKDASLFLNGKAGRKFLEPMYEKIHKKIRSVDDKKLIFIEPQMGNSIQSGFISTPGGEKYKNRTVYSYHIYCCLKNWAT